LAIIFQQLNGLKNHLSEAVTIIGKAIDHFEGAGTSVTSDNTLEVGIQTEDLERTSKGVDQSVQCEDPMFKEEPDMSPYEELGTSPGPSTTSSDVWSKIGRRSTVGCGFSHSRLSPETNVAEIFVTNLNQSATISDLMDFLGSKVTVLGLSQISHSRSRSKSFLLSVPLTEEYRVLDPSFWPAGVKFRNFVRPSSGRLANAGFAL
jgi:hypothetical protein